MKIRPVIAATAVAVALGLAGSAAQAASYDLTSIVNYNSTGTLPSMSGPSGPLVLVNNEYGNSYSAFTNGIAVNGSTTFSANFTFELNYTSYAPQADGLAFVVQNLGTSFLGGGGGGIGLYGAGGNSAAIVFQSWFNDHASIVTDENPYGGTQPTGNFSLGGNAGNLVNVAVNYDGTTLSYSATNTSTSQSISDSIALSLADLAGPSDTVYFGFTAGTGLSTDQAQIDSFHLNVSPVPLPGALPLFGAAIAGLVGFGVRQSRRAKAA